MCLPRLLVLLVLLSLATPVQAQEAAARPEHVPAELWDELLELEERIAAVESLRGRFERHRHTPLLRQPLVSEGVVYVKGDRVRWETESPTPSTTLVRDGEVRIYQPEERRVEVYALEQRAEQLGGGPLPRFSVMVEAFELAQVDPERVFDDLADEEATGVLALTLTPRDEAMADEVESMAMLLERETGRLHRLRIDSGESQWTEYRFIEIEADVDLPEGTFTLALPSDIEVVRPMEAGP